MRGTKDIQVTLLAGGLEHVAGMGKFASIHTVKVEPGAPTAKKSGEPDLCPGCNSCDDAACEGFGFEDPFGEALVARTEPLATFDRSRYSHFDVTFNRTSPMGKPITSVHRVFARDDMHAVGLAAMAVSPTPERRRIVSVAAVVAAKTDVA